MADRDRDPMLLHHTVQHSEQVQGKALQHKIITDSGRILASTDRDHRACTGQTAQGARNVPRALSGHIDQREIEIIRLTRGNHLEPVRVVVGMPKDDFRDALQPGAQTKGGHSVGGPRIEDRRLVWVDSCCGRGERRIAHAVETVFICNDLRSVFQVASKDKAICRSLSRAKLNKNDSAIGSTAEMAGSTLTQG